MQSKATPISIAALACLTTAIALPLTGCDDGTPPPARVVPAIPAQSTTGVSTTGRAVAPATKILTAADLIGTWIVDVASCRELAFNNALEAVLRSGSGLTDREIEEGSMGMVPDTITGRPVYTFTTNGKFDVVVGLYKDKFEGTWKVEGDTLTLTSPKFSRVYTYKLERDHFVSIPHTPRFKPIKIIPK